MIYLADANVLIAAALTTHSYHKAARQWFDKSPDFATTPITELALIRVATHRNYGFSFADALGALAAIQKLPNHFFWPAGVQVSAGLFKGQINSANTTDAYLLALARSMGGKLVTFDHGIRKIAEGAEAYVEFLAP
jgi:toxin-antitoxin system PIN domain toxin